MTAAMHRCARAALVCLELAGVAIGPAGAAPARDLAPGPAAAAVLEPGERQVYRIAPGLPGERAALRIAVEERGVDLEAELRFPDGTAWRVVTPDDRYAVNVLLVEGAAAGLPLELEVREAGRRTRPSPYAIAAEMLGAGTTAGRLAAERLTTQAQRARATGTPEARREALAHLAAALPLWQELGDVREQVLALQATAALHREGRDARSMLSAVERAEALAAALGDPLRDAVLRINVGFALFQLSRLEEAEGAYQEALGLLAGHDEPYAEAAILNNLGLVWHTRGELHTARGYYERALSLFEQAGDLGTVAAVTGNLGGFYHSLGEPDRGLALYRQALEIRRELGDLREEARLLGNIGLVERETGRYQEALTFFEQALAGARRLEDPGEEGRSLNNRGLIWRDLGEPERARADFEAALALRRQAGDRRGEAVTLGSLARLLADLGEQAAAAGLQEQALAHYRAIGDRRGEALALQALGSLRAGLGAAGEAARLLDEAVAALRALDARQPLCGALRQRGALRGESDPAAGVAALEEAFGACRAVQDRAGESEVLLALARVERSRGRLPAAQAAGEASLALAETLRAGLVDPALRTSFFARQQDAYVFVVDLLMERHRADPRAGFDRQALAVHERARARSLLDLLREAGAEPVPSADPVLLARRQSLEGRLGAKARHRLELLDRPGPAAGARGTTALRQAESELDALLADLAAIEAEIRTAARPAAAALASQRPLDAAVIPSLTDSDTLLLVYALGERRSFLWAVEPAGIESFELPPGAEIEEVARALHEAWRVFDPRSREEDRNVALRLSRLLLGPVAGRLGTRRLAVAADGALHYVPFAALPHPASGEPLVVSREVVSLPSVSVLAALREARAGRRPASGAGKQIAVLADPVFRPDDQRVRKVGRTVPPAGAGPDASSGAPERGGFDRLRWSRAEAEAITRLAGPGGTLVALDFDAALPLATSGALRGRRFVHFATHGLLDSRRPALSGLVLSLVDPAGQPQPGFLSLREVSSLDLAADLVVLSGCQTALGREVRGEGLVGLTRGFLQAGAARVLASLWRVQDRATAELMTQLYRALLTDGLPPPTALRQAQLTLLRDPKWSDPYYWAGFSLVGDWRL